MCREKIRQIVLKQLSDGTAQLKVLLTFFPVLSTLSVKLQKQLLMHARHHIYHFPCIHTST